MKIDDIREALETRWSATTAELCLRIVDYLAASSPEQLQMLTFRTLTCAAGKKSFDADVFSAVTILSSSEIDALDARAAFIDDDDEQYDIELEELYAARKTGSLVHPDTGELIADFEEKIIPYFVVSETFALG